MYICCCFVAVKYLHASITHLGMALVTALHIHQEPPQVKQFFMLCHALWSVFMGHMGLALHVGVWLA